MSTERRAQGPGMQQRPGGGMGPWGRGGMGMPVEKAKNFRATLTRLLGYFKPEKYRLLAVLIAAVISTIFTIVGPKILGLATTKLFEGIVMKLRGVAGARVDFDYILRILLFLIVV